MEDHLYFYARLKGISPLMEDDMVTRALTDVDLLRKRKQKVKTLSGGMKRRLSVAISLVSDPKIIYLDEPTTGLDPDNRRKLWEILKKVKGHRAIIITTHAMEEAEELCDDIGIMSEGILRCYGNKTRLKTKYGVGYHLFINCTKISQA
jgi:ABC-type multidrug transport system ATPase subunit